MRFETERREMTFGRWLGNDDRTRSRSADDVCSSHFGAGRRLRSAALNLPSKVSFVTTQSMSMLGLVLDNLIL